MNSWRVVVGDALERLRELEDGSVQTCVTSPPYFGLRDYGTGEWSGGDEGCDHTAAPTRTVGNAPSSKSTLTTNNGAGPQPGDKFHADQRREVATECPCGATRTDSQVGLEATPDAYVARLVEVFREVKRVLRDDGTLWLNLGDSYNAYNGNRGRSPGFSAAADQARNEPERGLTCDGCKQKDLLGIPWMVAFALRADGWYLRSDIIWNKPNPMPESVTDRPTKAHEYVFLLSKSPRYFYDADSIREDAAASTMAHQRQEGTLSYGHARVAGVPGQTPHAGSLHVNGADRPTTANKRSVWTVATQPFPGAHFAVFPPKLIEPCVVAGSAEGATVLDPFSGAGTTGLVATRLGRSYVGIELNESYAEMSRERIRDDAPLMNYILEQEEVEPTTNASRVPK